MRRGRRSAAGADPAPALSTLMPRLTPKQIQLFVIIAAMLIVPMMGILAIAGIVLMLDSMAGP
jgi:hypothetical protein